MKNKSEMIEFVFPAWIVFAFVIALGVGLLCAPSGNGYDLSLCPLLLGLILISVAAGLWLSQLVLS